MKFILPSLLILCALSTFGKVNAAVTTSGNFQTGTPTPTLSITEPFSLTISTTATVRYLIFDNWVTTDNGQNGALATANQFLFYTVNGGLVQQVGISQVTDNINVTVNSVTPGDGLITFDSLLVFAGQVMTFSSQSFTFGSGTNAFNPAIPTNFTGNVFLNDINGVAASNSVAVPEPATALLGLLTLPCLFFLRRKSS